VVMVAFAVVPACGGVEESSEAGAANAAPQSFTVGLDPATTAENVIPRIVAAGSTHLATVCEEHPDASVRILNPLVSGAYADVSCGSVLDGDGATGAASAALVIDASDGPVGEAKQRLGPISAVACLIAGAGTGLFTRYALCPHGRTERDRRNCEDTGLWGSIAIGVLCAVPF
jgi:hypothetical protein